MGVARRKGSFTPRGMAGMRPLFGPSIETVRREKPGAAVLRAGKARFEIPDTSKKSGTLHIPAMGKKPAVEMRVFCVANPVRRGNKTEWRLKKILPDGTRTGMAEEELKLLRPFMRTLKRRGWPSWI